MKKGLLAAALGVIAVAVFSVSMFASATPEATKIKTNPTAKAEVVTVADTEKASADATKVLESRFLNMLNHNFVYDNTFDSVEDIVNSSMPALLQNRDTENDSYISESYVADYVFNMYGIEDIDFSEINTEFENIDGYVYILPRGFTRYSHKIASITLNEDGSYTVNTKITSSSHDGTDYVDTCTTLFVPNANSAFGYNIIYSNIGGTHSAI